jgi:hypothetical protein
MNTSHQFFSVPGAVVLVLLLIVTVAPVMAAGAVSSAQSSEIDGWSYRQMVDEDTEEITLALHDRFVLLMMENSILEQRYVVESHQGLVIRDEAHQESDCGYKGQIGCEKHFWLMEAAEPGSHKLTFWMPCSAYQCTSNPLHFTVNVVVNPGEWNITTIDDTGSGSPAGAYPSLNIDRSGTPRISYYSSRNGTIMYGELQGNRWDLTPVADSAGTYSTSLALAPSGYPAISFGDGVHWGNLMYAERNGMSWDVRELDRGGNYQSTDDKGKSMNNGNFLGDAGEYSSLVFDGKGNPHITYNDGRYLGSLKYVTRDGLVWQKADLDNRSVDRGRWNSNTGFSSSLAAGPSGTLHVAYTDRKYYGNLMYAEWNGSAWTPARIDNGGSDTGSTGYDPSLALDSRGYPHISYYDRSAGGALRYASWNGTAWTIEAVDAITDVGSYSSLAIDRFDRPHISYYDNLYGELRYATWDPHSSQWLIRTVDNEGNVGSHTSIALDPSGHPSIAYYDEKNHALKFAKWIG